MDHRKLFAAGNRLGVNGPAIALGFYAVALMWSNRHLTDGFIPLSVIRKFPHVEHPLVVADALTKAGLFDRPNGGGGYQIHDFRDYNLSATKVKQRRKEDRERKARERN